MSWKKKFRKLHKAIKKVDPLMGKALDKVATYKDNGELDFAESFRKFREKTSPSTNLMDDEYGRTPIASMMNLTPLGGLPKGNTEIQAEADAKSQREAEIRNLSVTSPFTGGAQIAASGPLRTLSGDAVYGNNSQITPAYRGLLAKQVRRP